MQKCIVVLAFAIMAHSSFAQKATIRIIKAQAELKVPVLPPVRTVIEPVTIEFELKGRLAKGTKDTIIAFTLDNRTAANQPVLADISLKLDSTEWAPDGGVKKIKRDLYIRHAAVSEQKYDDNAYIYITTQPADYITVRFLSSATAAAGTTTPVTAAAIKPAPAKPATPDTFRFNKTFGYDNDKELFDLNIKKYTGKMEVKICSNKVAPAAAECFIRTLLDETDRKKFSAAFKDLMKKFASPGEALDADKISPSIDDLYDAATKSIEKQVPKEPTEAEKINSEGTEMAKANFLEKATKTSIGIFSLMDSVAPIRKAKTSAFDTLKIVSVEIVLSNGAIRKNGLKVKLTNNKIYRNKHSPISLYRLDKRKGDKLYVDDKRTGKSGYYLELGDIINYEYFKKFNYPSEETSYLSLKKPTDTLHIGSTVSELLDVSIYSDMLALLGHKANGIIQTQVTGTFITNTGNVRDLDLTFHNFVKAYFRLSKFDSKFAQVDSASFKNPATIDSINRLYLNQVAFLQAGIKTNILRMGVGTNQQLLLNAGAEISLTSADSLFNKDLVAINYYPELEYLINRLENFGLEASIKYIWQSVPKNSPFENKETVGIFNPQVVIYYYPFSNPNNKIYVKYAHFSQKGDYKYNYPQFQFGFKTNLFSKKEKTE